MRSKRFAGKRSGRRKRKRLTIHCQPFSKSLFRDVVPKAGLAPQPCDARLKPLRGCYHAGAVKGGCPPFTVAHYKLHFTFRATDSARSSPATTFATPKLKEKNRAPAKILRSKRFAGKRSGRRKRKRLTIHCQPFSMSPRRDVVPKAGLEPKIQN